jgi:hypothetical protein
MIYTVVYMSSLEDLLFPFQLESPLVLFLVL